jgi:hypothetical protein
MTTTQIIEGLKRLAVSDQGKRTVNSVAYYAVMEADRLNAEVEYLYECEAYDTVAAIFAVRRGDAEAALVAIRARVAAVTSVSA